MTAGDDGQWRERKEEREEEQVRGELTLDCVSALGDGGKERTMRMASSTATGRRGRRRGGRRRLARPRPDSLGAEGDKDAGMTSTGAISSGQTRVTAMRRRAAAAGVSRGRGTARGTREQGGGKRQARSSASWACVLDQQGGPRRRSCLRGHGGRAAWAAGRRPCRHSGGRDDTFTESPLADLN